MVRALCAVWRRVVLGRPLCRLAQSLVGYFCADVTIGVGGATRRKAERFDRRVKWPREHAICHAELATYVTRELIT